MSGKLESKSVVRDGRLKIESGYEPIVLCHC
jgi:hypothetical protein